MTKREYQQAIEKLGYSIVGAAEPLGISRRQAQRFHAGAKPVPKPVAKLLRAAVKFGFKPEEIAP